MTNSLLKSITFLGACMCFQQPVYSDLIIKVREVGPDVIATFSGSLDTSELILPLKGLGSGGVRGTGESGSVFVSGDSKLVLVDIYTGLTNFPIGIGPGTTVFYGNFATGDLGIGVQTLTNGTGRIFVYEGYVSGTPLFATTTWTNKTIEGLGLESGTYIWEWPTDRAILTIGVPEPASSVLFLVVLVVSFQFKRRKLK